MAALLRLRALSGRTMPYEPSPRYAHYAVPIGEKQYVWGGRTQNFIEGGKHQLKSVVEVFDPYLDAWERKPTCGTPPSGLYGGACAVLGESMYLCCGWDGDEWHNALHQLNSTTLEWKQVRVRAESLDEGPMRKTGCRMVACQGDKLALFGGFGTPSIPGRIQYGSTFTKNDMFPGRGRTNEFHLFHTREGIWSSPRTTGDRPPPCTSFSFTAINNDRAVLFGGLQLGLVNDIYILDFPTMHWTKIVNPGRGPWPVERAGHSACCLNSGKQHPQLLITGGWDKDNNTLRDAWVLDVDSATWKEIPLPDNVQPLCFHTTTAVSLGPTLTESTVFGGCPNFVLSESDQERPSKAETIVLQLSLNITEETPNQRILRERMAGLEQRAQGAERRVEQAERGRQEAEERAQEAERRAQGIQREAEATRQASDRRVQELATELANSEERRQEVTARAEQERERAEVSQREIERVRQEERSFWVVRREEIQLTHEELGRGAWATVKVATFRGSQVAAKCLHQVINSAHNRRLFIREMTMAARLRHSNLLQFIGATLEGDLIVLTELMPTSLRAVLEQLQRPLESPKITSISLDVSKALNYLHLMQPNAIIHRDISSANVLLEPHPNDSWKAKVSDYGSVNILRQLNTANPGNPTYAAPEAEFPSQQSPKMDIFSFGVLLVEMCTAEFPDVASRENLIQSIRDCRMVELIRHCISEDKDIRPTADEIIGRLRGL